MTYELINTLTTNTLACFDSQRAAEAALRRYKVDDPGFADQLTIVAFNGEGEAVEEIEADPRPVIMGQFYKRIAGRLGWPYPQHRATLSRSDLGQKSH